MKRKIVTLLLVSIMCVGGTACAGSTEGSTESSVEASSEVTIGEEAPATEAAEAVMSEAAGTTEEATTETPDASTEASSDAVDKKKSADTTSSITGTWQTASIVPGDDDSAQPEYYVQFTDSEIQYGHMEDGEFSLDHSDKISKMEETDNGGYKVQAETSDGVQYTFQTSEDDSEIMEYYETWNEDEFSEKYSGSGSLTKSND